jgi:hypothetical protein
MLVAGIRDRRLFEMIRQAAAVAIALCLFPSLTHAQMGSFTISASYAEVYKAPSTGSPVVGMMRRGSVLEVKRELGSWVSIPWPNAAEGEAFVHVSRGSLTRRPVVARATDSATPAVAAERSAVAEPVQRVEPTAGSLRSPLPPVYATPSHTLGVGARMGGPLFGGFGVSGRAWRERFGVQLSLSRHVMTNALGSERLTATRVDPSVLYRLPEHVGDYLWVRPYVGSGMSFHRQSVRSVPSTIDPPSDGGFGLQWFGGGEMTFANVPQVGVSLDLGYRWTKGPDVPGFDLTGPTFAVSAHWYVR